MMARWFAEHAGETWHEARERDARERPHAADVEEKRRRELAERPQESSHPKKPKGGAG